MSEQFVGCLIAFKHYKHYLDSRWQLSGNELADVKACHRGNIARDGSGIDQDLAHIVGTGP